MTEITEDMMQVNKKICKTCKYSCVYDGNGPSVCDYYLITGKRRKCPVGWCNHYENVSDGRRRKRNNMLDDQILKEDADEW